MNHQLQTLVFLFILIPTLAFSKGTRKKALTLTNGKYEEFFDTDSIEQIGLVLYNVNTQKIVGFTEVTSETVGSTSISPNIVSRWLSLDPLAAKYPSISPYVFVANSPIMFVDPDGREIYYIVNNQAIKAGKETLIRTANGRELYAKYAKNSKTDIYIGVGNLPDKNDGSRTLAATYRPYSVFVPIMDKKSGEQISSKRVLNRAWLPEGYESFKNVDISKSGSKDVFFIAFDSEITPGRSKYQVAETFYHEIKAHIDLSQVKEGQVSDESSDHTKLGLKYNYKKGKLLNIEVIPNSPQDKFNKQLEKVEEKDKPKPPPATNENK